MGVPVNFVFLPIDVDYRGTSGHVAGMMFNDPGLGKEPDARPLIEKEQTGIKVNFVANPNDRVTLNVEEPSVENVISKISDNHMIIHTDVNGTQTVSELIIISGGNEEVATTAETSEHLPTGAPAPQIAAASPSPELADENTDQNL